MIEFDEELIRNHYIENIEKLSSGTPLTPWEMINYFCRWQFDSFKSAYAALKEENDKLRAENERLKKSIEQLANFDEKEFKRQWCIRGVGMPMDHGSAHGARCFHHWFVTPVIKDLRGADAPR